MVRKTINPENVARYADNLTEAWNAADPAWLARGLTWYDEASAEIRALASAAGVPFATACGVATALSIDNSWRKNLKGLGEALSAHKRGECIPRSAHRYGMVRAKAQAILDGADPDWVLNNNGKGSSSYKTRRFYANLCGDLSVVTVDRHHNRACKADPSVGVPESYDYLECEEATIVAAARFGLEGGPFQAGLWTATLENAAY